MASPTTDASVPSDSPRASGRSTSGTYLTRNQRRILITFGIVLFAIWVSPILVANSSLRDTLLNSAITSRQGKISTTGASLGWFSPVVLVGIEVRDPEGTVLASAPTVISNKSLLSLALGGSTLGTYRVDRPQVEVILRPDGSNLEDFLEPWLDSKDDSPTKTTVTVEIVDGTVVLNEEFGGRSWNLEDVNATYSQTPQAASANVKAKVLGAGVNSAVGTAPLALTLKMPLDDDDEPGEAEFRTTGFPLAALQPLAKRVMPGAELGGMLNTDLKCEWNIDGRAEKMRIEGDAQVNQLSVASNALQKDRLYLERLHFPCHLEIDRERIAVQRLRLDSELGQFDVTGTLTPKDFSTGELLAALARDTYSVTGELDLVQLAALLPQTLRIREGTKITSGKLKLLVENKPAGGSHALQAKLETGRISAIAGTKQLQWNQPILILVDATSSANHWRVEKLDCRSDFLMLSASGTPDRFTGKANFDLNELVDQLHQFVDLQGWSVSGQGQLAFNWNHLPGNNFQVETGLRVAHFQLTGTDRMPWIEEQLSLDASASGSLDGAAPKGLTQAQVKLTAGGDQLDAQLTKAVADISEKLPWPLDLKVTGGIASWALRGSPWITFPSNLQLDGAGHLTAQAIYSSDELEIRNASLKATNFRWYGYGLSINEPKIELFDVEGKYRFADRIATMATATLASPTVSLRANNVRVELLPVGLPNISGIVAINGAIDRMQQWTIDPQKPSPWRLFGQLGGQVEVSLRGNVTDVNGQLTAQDLQLAEAVPRAAGAPSLQVKWREDRLNFQTNASYDRATDRAELKTAQIASSTVNLAASGAIDNLLTRQLVNLSGTIDYDLAQLTPLFEPYLGRDVKLVGKDTARFKVNGPLQSARVTTDGMASVGGHWSRQITGEAGFGWQQAAIKGFQLGAGRLDAQLSGGMVRFTPFDIPVSEGRLTSAPVLQLDPAPLQLFIPKGELIRNMRFSPEVVDKSLKYVAPILSEATRTEGQFSVTMEGGRVPLATPEKSDLSGFLVVHKAEVLPGPLAEQFILLGKQIEAIAGRRAPPISLTQQQKPLVKLDNQSVEFRVVEGRVYHRGMDVVAGSVRIHTQGSVGFDQTLALTADVPIEDRWLGSDAVAQGLRGQTIQVPISGTLTRPRVDSTAVEQFANKMLREAAKNILADELNKQLDKLLPKR